MKDDKKWKYEIHIIVVWITNMPRFLMISAICIMFGEKYIFSRKKMVGYHKIVE